MARNQRHRSFGARETEGQLTRCAADGSDVYADLRYMHGTFRRHPARSRVAGFVDDAGGGHGRLLDGIRSAIRRAWVCTANDFTTAKVGSVDPEPARPDRNPRSWRCGQIHLERGSGSWLGSVHSPPASLRVDAARTCVRRVSWPRLQSEVAATGIRSVTPNP